MKRLLLFAAVVLSVIYGAIRGMLPRDWSYLGENFPRTGRGQGGVCHLFRSPAMGFQNYGVRNRVFRATINHQPAPDPNRQLSPRHPRFPPTAAPGCR